MNPNIVLGRGHYAIVNLGVCKQTGRQVAVKRIQISKSRVEALQREVHVLKKIGSHPNIVSLFDIFITNTELQLVLELLKGGELFDRMVEKGPYSEREASHHVRKIGLALKYLHRHGIVHRDLKPENLILADKSDDSELKIADFGLSRIVDDVASSTMQTVCGTWAYCAPEVKTSVVQATPSPPSPVDGTTKTAASQSVACYTAAVDLWSVGVILFVILGAYHPFDPDGDASDGQLWERICTGEFDFDDPAWDNISDLAKDLIRKLIVVDPAKRFTTDQLLAHPWVTLTASVPATPITPAIDKSLGGFVKHKKAMTPKLGMSGLNQMHQFNPNAMAQHQMGMQQPYLHQQGMQGQYQYQAHPNQGFQINHQPQVQMLGVSTAQQPPQPHFGVMNQLHHQQQVAGHPHQSTVTFNMNPTTIGGVDAMAHHQNMNLQSAPQMNHVGGVPTHSMSGSPVGGVNLGLESQQNPGLTLDTLLAKENDLPDVMDLVTPTNN